MYVLFAFSKKLIYFFLLTYMYIVGFDIEVNVKVIKKTYVKNLD